MSVKSKLGLAQSHSEYCNYLIQQKKRTISIILIIFLVLSTIGIVFLYLGESAIVEIRYNFKSSSFSPIQTIQVTNDNETNSGLFASKTNATFEPMYLMVGIFGTGGSLIYGIEGNYGQYIQQKVISDGNFESLLSDLDESSVQFLSTCVIPIKDSLEASFKIRLSADYFIVVQVYMKINFNDINIQDVIIPFIYIANHGDLNSSDYPIGSSLISLQNGQTTTIDINDIYYEYPIISAYYSLWTENENVTPYPFLLEAEISTAFNFGNYVNVL